MKVSNFEVKDKIIKVGEKFAHLVPKTVIPQTVQFELSGVSAAFSNAIRRTIEGEIAVAALSFEYEDFRTDDVFIINTMILDRIRLLPILQNVPKGVQFELDVANKTDQEVYIHSGDIKMRGGGKLPFNETFPLFTLKPGKYLRISKIVVRYDYGYNFSGHSLASNSVSLALDQEPYNAETGQGVLSHVSNPRRFLIRFNSLGLMDARDIVKAACDNIIGRLHAVSGILHTINSSEDIDLLTIDGESHTIGTLLMRTIYEKYPDIYTVTYSMDPNMRRITLKIRCEEDVNSLLTSTIKHIVDQLQDLKVKIAK